MNRLFYQGPIILAQWDIQVVLSANIVDLEEPGLSWVVANGWVESLSKLFNATKCQMLMEKHSTGSVAEMARFRESAGKDEKSFVVRASG